MKRLRAHNHLLSKYVFSCFVFFVFCIFCINYWIIKKAHPFIVSSIEQLSGTQQVALVLGAKVYSDGRVSYAVQERADAAIALRKAKKVEKILVSGDNRTKRYDEVTTIKKYLLKQGVPASIVFLDYAGLDTYDSMYRAQYIFDVKSMVVPTQEFHSARALYIAHALGIDAQGIITHTLPLPNMNHLIFRERGARVKAFFDVNFHALPHHLGEKISLSGKSNSE